MSLRKRTSRVLENAELRCAGLKAINVNLDLGEIYNLKSMTQLIEQLRAKIESHNIALSAIDSSKIEIEELEQTLSTFSEKMLMGIGFKYGKNSREYEMAGGVRKSERIRKSRATRLKTISQKASNGTSQTT